MTRQPILARDAQRINQLSIQRVGEARGAPVEEDDYATRLVKFVPAEAVTAFVAVSAVMPLVERMRVPIWWSVFFIILLGAGGYAWKSDVGGDRKSHKIKSAVAMAAFAVWVFSIGGPFAETSWYEEPLGDILLVLFVFLVPLLVK